jgi:hypothetical protein
MDNIALPRWVLPLTEVSGVSPGKHLFVSDDDHAVQEPLGHVRFALDL